MPHDPITLGDVRSPTIEILCELCGRHRRYDVEQLMAEHGDAVLATLAGQRLRPVQGRGTGL
jgi:hypothetical protein